MLMLAKLVKIQSKNYYHMVINQKLEIKEGEIDGKSKNSKNNT